MRRARLALVSTLATLATLATNVHADGSPKPDARRVIGVLEVKVDGVPPEIAAQFQSALESQLDSKRYWLSTRAKMKERMGVSTKWTDGCVVGKCLFDVKTQTGAELVLIAALSGSGTSYGYVVTLLRTDRGEVVAQQTDRCDVCTLNEVMTNATLATIQLINAVPDQLPDDEAERHAAVSLAVVPVQQDLARVRHATKRTGLALTIGGLVVGGLGAALYLTTDKPYALAVSGVGGGLLAGGVTILAF